MRGFLGFKPTAITDSRALRKTYRPPSSNPSRAGSVLLLMVTVGIDFSQAQIAGLNFQPGVRRDIMGFEGV